MWNTNRGYYYGVLLGDGFYGKPSPPRGSAYVMLKSIDRDFVERWQAVLEEITGRQYAIGTLKPAAKNRRPLHFAKCYNKELVEESIEVTRDKTVVPNGILMADALVKKSFIQGLMDSEAWITAKLQSLGACTVQMTFGVTDPWIRDVHTMFGELGIGVSRIYTRKFKDDPKYLKPRKNLMYFNIDILEYVDAGLGFNIKRKSDRLRFCSKILRDYTRDYPRYADYYAPAG